MSQPRWTAHDIPPQTGRVAVVTGANSGIGFETAKALAAKGATVILACRNPQKAAAAAERIRQQLPAAKLELRTLDLADLASVRAFAEQFANDHARLDLLINNAGVMIPPLTRTKDGFELQFGVNHLGHFALTGLLLERLLATPKARVVTVSSGAHKLGKGELDFDNLNAEKAYVPWNAYMQSKLANLLFTLELSKRLQAIGADTLAVSAHPGWSATELQRGFMRFMTRLVGQSAEMGALPTLYAAVAEVPPNAYVGPSGFMETRGYPTLVEPSAAAKDEATARRLWEVSEALTGVRYELLDAARTAA